MKVHVDMDLRQSHGECVFSAPDVFQRGDDRHAAAAIRAAFQLFAAFWQRTHH